MPSFRSIPNLIPKMAPCSRAKQYRCNGCGNKTAARLVGSSTTVYPYASDFGSPLWEIYDGIEFTPEYVPEPDPEYELTE
jgi:hypothetical protein